MHVTVAIVGFRNSADVLRCLSALDRTTHSDFDVVICENGGPLAYAELMSALPASLTGGQAVRAVLAPGNLGYAGGVNRCLAESPASDAWWVLNPDTEPHADAMELQAARLSSGDCDAIGCTVYLPDGKVQSYGGRWQAWLARAVSIGHGTSLGQSPAASVIEATQNYLNGASMMVSRRFLETAGPMREDYFLYCEEVEWCLRAITKGLRLGFEPTAMVLHHQGTTTGNIPDIKQRSKMPIYLSERNRINLTRDCFPGWLGIVAITSFAVMLAKYLRRGAWRQFGYGVAGWAAGLGNIRGTPAAAVRAR